MNILCPVCGKKLIRNEKTWNCASSHSFDIAREGYVNLNMHKSQNTGDSREMIEARRRFLSKGFYGFLQEKIDSLLKPGTLVDLACGEGYYTSRFSPSDKIGIDLSKTGLKAAARRDRNTVYILSSIFRTPLEDSCADNVLTIFAPVAKQEICRIMKQDGQFILVRPDEYHLYELKEKIYEEPYLNQTEETAIEGLSLKERIRISDRRLLDPEETADLFTMTPYYNTTSPSDKEKISRLESLQISFCFLIDIYTR